MSHELGWRLSQKQLKRIGVFILCLLAFFIPYQMEFYVPQLFGAVLSPVNILGIILFTLLVFKILATQRLPRIPYGVWWLLFVIVASIAYALGPRATSPLQGLWVIFKLAIVPPLFYVGAVVFLTDSDIRQIIKIVAISAALAGLVAVVQTVSGGRLLDGYLTNHRYLGFLQPLLQEVVTDDTLLTNLYLAGTNLYRGHGTFYTANSFGAFISVTACLTWGLLRSSTGKRRWFWLFIFVAQVMGSVASFSRSSWAALAVGIGIAVLLEVILIGGKQSVSRLIRFMPGFLVLLIIIGVVVSRSEKVAEHFVTIFNPAKVPEFTWRQTVWKTALHEIKKHPWIGSGETDVYAMTDWTGTKTSYSAHNLFVGIAYELGIPSLMIFLFFAANLFHSAWRYIKHTTLIPERMLAVGVLAAGVSFLVAGVGSVLLYVENMATLFWLMVGLANKINRE